MLFCVLVRCATKPELGESENYTYVRYRKTESNGSERIGCFLGKLAPIVYVIGVACIQKNSLLIAQITSEGIPFLCISHLNSNFLCSAVFYSLHQ